MSTHGTIVIIFYLLFRLLLLPRRCQSYILFLLCLDPGSFASTSRLGQSSDLFLAKSCPQFFPIWKINPAKNALDKFLPILGDCV